MPNWVENDLRVEIPYDLKGTELETAKKQFKDIKLLLKTKDDKAKLDFNDFISYPKKFVDLDIKAKLHNAKQTDWRDHIKDGFNQGGYNWCTNFWGTKWNAKSVEFIDAFDEELAISFDTAWSPPMKVIIAMSKKFTLLNFDMRSFEMGNEFNSVIVCVDGKIQKEEYGKYFGNRGG